MFGGDPRAFRGDQADPDAQLRRQRAARGRARTRLACRVLKMRGSTHSPEKRRLIIEQGGLRVEKVSAWTTAWPFRPTRARCVTSSGAASLHPTRTTAPSFSARSSAAGGKQGGRSTRGAAAHLRGRRLAGRPRGVLARGGERPPERLAPREAGSVARPAPCGGTAAAR